MHFISILTRPLSSQDSISHQTYGTTVLSCCKNSHGRDKSHFLPGAPSQWGTPEFISRGTQLDMHTITLHQRLGEERPRRNAPAHHIRVSGRGVPACLVSSLHVCVCVCICDTSAATGSVCYSVWFLTALHATLVCTRWWVQVQQRQPKTARSLNSCQILY